MLPIFSRSRQNEIVLGRHSRLPLSPLRRIGEKERGEHCHVIGAPGMGKSKLLEYVAFQDIAAGCGHGLIDPHSLLADDLLRLLITKGTIRNPAVRDQLIYVDPTRTDHVVPFNVLATQDDPYDIAASVLEAFRRTWPESLREAPHFSNVMMASLLVLIANQLTLMDMPKLLANKDFRERCLEKVADRDVVAFFHDRYDKWGKEAPLMRESTLNKIGAFSLNPRLRLMLGQRANHLDFRAIMDEGKVLLVDLGACDPETNRLIGSLIVTGLELAMRRREKRNLWNLTIDEFASYVANEGSVKTLAQVFSEGRKFRLAMTVAHQDLTQLTPRMLGALTKCQKIVFGVSRPDAEYFARLIGRIDTEAVKRDPRSETQYELFSSHQDQWENWIDSLRFQKPRRATVASPNGRVSLIRTISIPRYTATDEEVEALKHASASRWGIPYRQACRDVEKSEAQSTGPDPVWNDQIFSS